MERGDCMRKLYAVLGYSEVMEWKRIAEERFSAKLHFHDACGGQSFSLEKPNQALKAFLTSYCADRNLHVVFSEDGLRFTVES